MIDLLTVFHNNRAHIPRFLEGLKRIKTPVKAYFLDNDSRDGTPDMLAGLVNTLPFPAYVLRSSRNNGFARGVNLLAKQGQAEWMFLLNPDTELQPGSLETLLARAQVDPKIAICEARQFPREHPKAYDVATGETTWCSGAAALVRRSAFSSLSGFDEPLYFMYCEDIDLSWRLWLTGWKCLYVPEAVVHHFTQDLTPGKRRTREHYFDFRNTLFLYHRFAGPKDRPLLRSFLSTRLLSRSYSIKSRVLFGIALIDHIRYIPYLLHSRDNWRGPEHPWVRLKETSLSH